MYYFNMNRPESAANPHPDGPRRQIQEDASGRLYDRRLRDMLAREAEARPESRMAALEALAALRVAAKGTHHLLDRWSDRHGLSEGRLHLLLCLKRGEGRPRAAGELATALDVSPRNVTGLVDHLETDGLVRRTDDPSDRRSVLVELTPLGWDKIAQIWQDALWAQNEITQDFTDEELAQLRHLCLRLVRGIESLHPAPPASGTTHEESR